MKRRWCAAFKSVAAARPSNPDRLLVVYSVVDSRTLLAIVCEDRMRLFTHVIKAARTEQLAHACPTCSAHIAVQADAAVQRARRMRLESPVSPPAQPAPIPAFPQRRTEPTEQLSTSQSWPTPGGASPFLTAARTAANRPAGR